jgi:hypothetical protein
MAHITVSKWMPFRQNTLRGFAEGNFGPSLTISDVPVHTKNGRSWASLPSKPMISAEGTVLRAERKAVAGLLFRLIRQQANQQEIEAAAYAEGERQGLSKAEVIRVALWVCQEAISRRAA